jgi:hypothetical protein
MVAALSSSCRPNTTIRPITLAYTNLSPQVIGSKQYNALRGQFRYRCLRFTLAWLLIDKKKVLAYYDRLRWIVAVLVLRY